MTLAAAAAPALVVTGVRCALIRCDLTTSVGLLLPAVMKVGLLPVGVGLRGMRVTSMTWIVESSAASSPAATGGAVSCSWKMRRPTAGGV